jgi:hypothetical protein
MCSGIRCRGADNSRSMIPIRGPRCPGCGTAVRSAGGSGTAVHTIGSPSYAESVRLRCGAERARARVTSRWGAAPTPSALACGGTLRDDLAPAPVISPAPRGRPPGRRANRRGPPGPAPAGARKWESAPQRHGRQRQQFLRLGECAGQGALDGHRPQREHGDRGGKSAAQQAGDHHLAALGEHAGRKVREASDPTKSHTA